MIAIFGGTCSELRLSLRTVSRVRQLEREYILDTLRLLEEALGVSDLVPLFEGFK